MTHQEVFEKVKAHLLSQMGKAKDNEGIRCLYRAPNGMKCAIGCLIPDKNYRPEFDVGYMGLTKIVLEVPALRGLNIAFLLSLQRVHDGNPVDKWASALDHIEEYWKTQGLLS